MWVVIERLYVRVTPRTEMRWTLSKPCTMGGGRSVCRQDLRPWFSKYNFLGLRSIEFKVIAVGLLFDMLDLGLQVF